MRTGSTSLGRRSPQGNRRVLSSWIVIAFALLSLVLLASAASAATPSRSSGPVSPPAGAPDNDQPKGQADYSGAGAEQRAAAPWNCTVVTDDPHKFANTIDGEASQFCSGVGWAPQRIVVSIQRLRWYGWQTVASRDSGDVWVDFVSRDLLYDCGGTGTYTYRVVGTGYAAGGTRSLSVQSQNTLRVAC